MSGVGLLIVLFALGVLILVAEIFIPSHGVLSVVGVGFLIAGILKTFADMGSEAGVLAVGGTLVFVPTLAFVAIKYWRQTPMGRAIAPPNPTYTSADSPLPVEQILKLVGRNGTAISPLRPVGICEFDGRRVSCVAQYGMIEAGTAVEGVEVSGGNLMVTEKQA